VLGRLCLPRPSHETGGKGTPTTTTRAQATGSDALQATRAHDAQRRTTCLPALAYFRSNAASPFAASARRRCRPMRHAGRRLYRGHANKALLGARHHRFDDRGHCVGAGSCRTSSSRATHCAARSRRRLRCCRANSWCCAAAVHSPKPSTACSACRRAGPARTATGRSFGGRTVTASGCSATRGRRSTHPASASIMQFPSTHS